MTKTVKICDKCQKETCWLYKIPHVLIEGLQINLYEGRHEQELCEKCAKELVSQINKFSKG